MEGFTFAKFDTEASSLSVFHHLSTILLGANPLSCDNGWNESLCARFLACCNTLRMATMWSGVWIRPGSDLSQPGKAQTNGAVAWQKRLQIAIGAAKGLEYLHDGCKPAIVHRDVKPANILLDEFLEEKIADFGLSKKVADTGHIDPEYQKTRTNFGVVLFQLITGKPAIARDRKGRSASLTQWVKRRILKGVMESLIDPELKGFYRNLNSILGVAEIANLAILEDSNKRPNMTGIVTALMEAMKLEVSSLQGEQSFETSNDLYSAVVGSTNPVPR